MNVVYLGLGSNVGSRYNNLEECLLKLQDINGLLITKISSVYETDPIGYTDQDKFLNMAIETIYNYSPHKLLAEVKNIEKIMGRNTKFRWGPRNIDIDIIYFGNKVLKSDDLTIPHKEVLNRKFVLKPLMEIAPELVCPLTGIKISDLSKENANIYDDIKDFGIIAKDVIVKQ
ncbi:2-amino-4-hydroxy-6-hydroxymethyldihydropteridine diphosphokinase [candidate division KSB1 bacterium]